MTKKTHKNSLLLEKILKWIELLFFGFVLALFFIGLYYFNSCNPSCHEIIEESANLSLIISSIFIIGGIINSLRILIIFKIFDNDPKSQNGLYLSLISSSVSLGLYGIFHHQVYSPSTIENHNPFFWFIQTILFILAAGSLFADKKSWHQSNHFVRVRLSLTLFFLAVMLISPITSIITFAIILPFLIFIKPPKNEIKKK